MLEKLSADKFKFLVNSDFQGVVSGNKTCSLKLINVETHSFEPENIDFKREREAFSLMFVAPEDFIEQQGHVELSHPDLEGPMHVFMVVLEKLEDHLGFIRCQVAFN